MRRAQTSTEFTILVGVMLLIFVVFFAVVIYRMVSIQERNDLESMNQLGNIITNEFKLAQQVRDDYHRSFIIPDNINGEPYQLSFLVYSGGADLEIKMGTQSSVRFIDGNFVGAVVQGMNNITKRNGVIYVNTP